MIESTTTPNAAAAAAAVEAKPSSLKCYSRQDSEVKMPSPHPDSYPKFLERSDVFFPPRDAQFAVDTNIQGNRCGFEEGEEDDDDADHEMVTAEMMTTPRKYDGKIDRKSLRSKRRSATERSSSSPDRKSPNHLKIDKITMKPPPHELSRREKKKLSFSFLPELTGRYKCLRVLGSGSYGRVFECWDRDKRMRVAIKCQSAFISDSIKREIRVMEQIQAERIRGQMAAQSDKLPESYCIELYDWFEMPDHNCICMVLEKCPHNLDELIQEISARRPSGVSLSLVRKWTTQILVALKTLHDLDMVHSDLKPENIMLVPSKSSRTDKYNRYDDRSSSRSKSHRYATSKRDLDVRLIDFGLSMRVDEIKTRVIGTRQFSAPEILLKIGWGQPLDMWALGCLVCELVTGRTLFDTHDNLEHLAIIAAVLSRPIPHDLVRRCREVSGDISRYFGEDYGLRWPEMAAAESSVSFVARRKPLDELLRADENPDLYDFVSKLLQYRPEDRMTSAEALSHPFITKS